VMLPGPASSGRRNASGSFGALRAWLGSILEFLSNSKFGQWSLHTVAGGAVVLGLLWFLAPAKEDLPCAALYRHRPRTLSPNETNLPAFNNQVVHITGNLHDVPLEDPIFGFKRNGVKLSRHVQMFQWEPVGRERYRKIWSSELIDSKDHAHGHLNPLMMPFKNHTQFSLPIRISGSALLNFGRELNHHFDNFTSMAEVTSEDLQHLSSDLHGTLRVADGYFYRGRDMRYPSVGDVRVWFEVVAETQVSAIGLLRAHSIRACDSDNHKKRGKYSAGSSFARAPKIQ